LSHGKQRSDTQKEEDMLRSLKSLIGYRIHATDGEIGHVDDFYFDDRKWSVRYVAVDIGPWRYRRQVLLSPNNAVEDDSMDRVLGVPLTRQQVEDSPGVDTDPPISRQEEKIFHDSYSPLPYMGAGGIFSIDPFMPEWYFQPLNDPPGAPLEVVGQANGDRHLQSGRELIGYHVEATDGPIGHVEDLVLDDARWRIRHLVVHTHEWITGTKVLVSPRLVDELSWPAAKVYLNVPRSRIEHSTKFDPSAPASSEREEVEFDYYGRPKHWKKLTRAARRGKSTRTGNRASGKETARA
jgi:sporulation protein YlmC with PRC-barrel domain